MPRTTDGAVRAILGDDYDTDTSPSLTPYIIAANLIVSRVNTCAVAKGITLSTDELREIEAWLAAHAYSCSDKNYTSRSTAGASGSFAGQTGMGFDATLYGQMAIRIDYSGCLAAIDKRHVARGVWLGLPPSEQTNYEDRD